MTLKIIRPKRITGVDFLTAIALSIVLGIAIHFEQNHPTDDVRKQPKHSL